MQEERHTCFFKKVNSYVIVCWQILENVYVAVRFKLRVATSGRIHFHLFVLLCISKNKKNIIFNIMKMEKNESCLLIFGISKLKCIRNK